MEKVQWNSVDKKQNGLRANIVCKYYFANKMQVLFGIN